MLQMVFFQSKKEPIIVDGEKVIVDKNSYINRIYADLKEKSNSTSKFNKDSLLV